MKVSQRTKGNLVKAKMGSDEYFIDATPQVEANRKDGQASLAGLGARCSAFLLDYILTLLIPALALIVGVYLKRRWLAPSAANAVVLMGYVATAALLFFNQIYFYVQEGQSFGKRFIRLRVVRTDGAPLDYKTVIIRHVIGYPLSLIFFCLGFLWMLWDAKRQCWHDKLASTIVVKD